MSAMVEAAVAALKEKIGDDGFDGSAKFVIDGEGAIVIDADGVRAGDDDTEVTMTADAETFKGLLDGDLDPTAAFMGGRLVVDGDMGLAMKLGALLS